MGFFPQEFCKKGIVIVSYLHTCDLGITLEEKFLVLELQFGTFKKLFLAPLLRIITVIPFRLATDMEICIG